MLLFCSLENQSFEQTKNSLETSEIKHLNLIACFAFLHQDQYKMGQDVPVRNLIKLQLRLENKVFTPRHFNVACFLFLLLLLHHLLLLL